MELLLVCGRAGKLGLLLLGLLLLFSSDDVTTTSLGRARCGRGGGVSRLTTSLRGCALPNFSQTLSCICSRVSL